MNAKIGGLNIDGVWQAQRTEGDVGALDLLLSPFREARTGEIRDELRERVPKGRIVYNQSTVLARLMRSAHRQAPTVPFLVVAPETTVDPGTPTGSHIPIEDLRRLQASPEAPRVRA